MKQAEALYQVFTKLNDFDEQICSTTIEMLKKENISDCLKYFSDNENLLSYELYISQVRILSLINQQKTQKIVKNNTKIMINILKYVKDHDFNKKNYSTDIYKESRKHLIQKISKDEKIVQFLKFLVHLTAIDKQFIQSGSNSLNILVYMKVDLTNQSFEKIRIENTSLMGGNFFRCNLNENQNSKMWIQVE